MEIKSRIGIATLLAVLLACFGLPGSLADSNINQSCYCGQTLVDDICQKLPDVDTALTEYCNVSGRVKNPEDGDGDQSQQGLCTDPRDGESVCLCRCGWEGDLCDTKVEPLDYNLYIGIILPVVFFLGFVVLLVIRDLKFSGKADFDISSDRVVKPMFNASPIILLVLRGSFFIIGAVFLLMALIQSPGGFFFFTVWNWALLTVNFGIGTYLSVMFFIRGSANRTRLNFIEKVFWILFEIEFPATILILLVVWAVLLPSLLAITDDTSELVNAFSLFSHALNVLFYCSEMALNGLYIKFAHFSYLVLWGATYLIVHNGIMVGVNAAGGDHCPAYPFLTMSSSIFTVWILGLLAACFIFYLITWGLSKLKAKVVGNAYLSRENQPFDEEAK